MDEEYNDFVNKITQEVLMWLRDDENSYDSNTNKVVRSDEYLSFLNKAKKLNEYDLASELEEYYTVEIFPLKGSSLYFNLLKDVLQVVSWREIAREIIDESTNGDI